MEVACGPWVGAQEGGVHSVARVEGAARTRRSDAQWRRSGAKTVVQETALNRVCGLRTRLWTPPYGTVRPSIFFFFVFVFRATAVMRGARQSAP